MAAEYGTDWDCVSDIDEYGTTVSGPEAVAQAIARRLQTPPGGLIDDPTYGYDLRALLNRTLTRAEQQDVRASVEAQCLLDERVDSADVEIDLDGEELTVTVSPELAGGETFELTFQLSSSNLGIVYNGVGWPA